MDANQKPHVQHFGDGHGNGVHDFLMDELEIGERAAYAADMEAAMGSWEPLASAFDPSYPGYLFREAS